MAKVEATQDLFTGQKAGDVFDDNVIPSGVREAMIEQGVLVKTKQAKPKAAPKPKAKAKAKPELKPEPEADPEAEKSDE